MVHPSIFAYLRLRFQREGFALRGNPVKVCYLPLTGLLPGKAEAFKVSEVTLDNEVGNRDSVGLQNVVNCSCCQSVVLVEDHQYLKVQEREGLPQAFADNAEGAASFEGCGYVCGVLCGFGHRWSFRGWVTAN